MRSGLYAVLGGREYAAALTPDQREAILVLAVDTDDDPPPGFERIQPDLCQRVVARSDLTILFRIFPACTYRGEQFQVIEDRGDRLRLKYLGGDERVAEDLGLEFVEPAVYQVTVSREDVEDVHEVRRQLR
ncbi:MAG: hypothetical protein GEV03_22755 [Streptosporangiales bacterium]|nr:hypothetical protein [Streptosporangiales bacterium]